MASRKTTHAVAPALAYLDTLGEFGELARTILVADAAERIGDLEPFDEDATTALRHMRRCLLAAGTAPRRTAKASIN